MFTTWAALSVAPLPEARQIVLTSRDGALAAPAAPEIERRLGRPLLLRSGGTQAWQQGGLALEAGLDAARALSDPDDVDKRPYEGTDDDGAAMQACLDRQFGLVAQLGRTGAHGLPC